MTCLIYQRASLDFDALLKFWYKFVWDIQVKKEETV